MCELEELLDKSKSEFRFLIAFVLAGFVAASVRTWAARRSSYASLCGNARNLSIQIGALLAVDGGDRAIAASRTMLNRWVMLAFELAVLKARGLMDAEAGRAHLQQLKLLEEGEWEAMIQGDRHTTVFWWILTELVRLSRAGKLEIQYVQSLTVNVSSMRGQANDLMSCLDRDKPFAYASLCGTLVYINLIIFSTWKGVAWAVWWHSHGDNLAHQPKFWVDVLVLFSWNVSYKALYDLGYLLHNPFGDRRLDVAHEIIGGGIGRLSAAVARVDGHLPPAIAACVSPLKSKAEQAADAAERAELPAQRQHIDASFNAALQSQLNESTAKQRSREKAPPKLTKGESFEAMQAEDRHTPNKDRPHRRTYTAKDRHDAALRLQSRHRGRQERDATALRRSSGLVDRRRERVL